MDPTKLQSWRTFRYQDLRLVDCFRCLSQVTRKAEDSIRISLPANGLEVEDIRIDTSESGFVDVMRRRPVPLAFDPAVAKLCQTKLDQAGPETSPVR